MKARSSLSVIVFAARMPGTHHPYARCSSPVYPILGRHLHRDRKTTTALHPVLPMNKAVKQKGEGGERDEKHTKETFWRIKNIHRKKDATSFFKTCTSFRWNLLHLFRRDATSFFERHYVFLKEMLRLFQAGRSYIDVKYMGWINALSQLTFSRLLRNRFNFYNISFLFLDQ